MELIDDKTRKALQALRICQVNEPELTAVQGISAEGQRILVPLEYYDLFKEIQNHGGSIGAQPLRQAVEHVARTKLGAKYHRRATIEDAPRLYSCSSLMKAVFAFVGIHLPRFAIDQSYVGRMITEPVQGALLFGKSLHPIHDADRQVGHVSLVTSHFTRIHAANEERGVCEDVLDPGPALMIDPFPRKDHVLVIFPNKIQGLETALDLARWLQRAPHKR